MISNKGKHFLVIHKLLLPEASGHQQNIELRRFGDAHFGRQRLAPGYPGPATSFSLSHEWLESGIRDSTSNGPVKSIWSIRGKIKQPIVKWLLWSAGLFLAEIVIAVSISKYSYLLPGSIGNMHSIRNSCAVMDCGVPTVVMSEKYEKRSLPFTKVIGTTGP